MRRLLRTVLLLTVLLCIALAAGFASFVSAAHQPAGPVPDSDGIVALTGGAERVETALHLLASDRARLLLVSGVHGAALPELLNRAGLPPSPLGARVTLGREAATTLGNAQETAAWVRQHQIHSLIVVTSGFHMPRALLELRRTVPDVALFPMPVQPQAAGRLGSARMLLIEYAKLLAAWAGLSRVVPQPISVVWRPVDKSVAG